MELVVGEATPLIGRHDEAADEVVRHDRAEVLLVGFVDAGADEHGPALVDGDLEVGIQLGADGVRRVGVR